MLNQSDKLLISSNGTCLKLCETSSERGTQFGNNNSIETSIHARSNGGMLHRPHSVLENSLILSSLASTENSIDNGLDLLMENESPSSPTVHGNLSSALVHLAKNRPKPARLMRNIVGRNFF